jgi:hypothetical protein
MNVDAKKESAKMKRNNVKKEENSREKALKCIDIESL